LPETTGSQLLAFIVEQIFFITVVRLMDGDKIVTTESEERTESESLP
jgi:hypothetical protein